MKFGLYKEQLSNTWQKNLQGLDTNNMTDTWSITIRLANITPNIPPLTIYGKTETTIQGKLNAFPDTVEYILTTNSGVDRIVTCYSD
jgi:hypothetical protein